jgi:hypothetical protein
MVAQAVSAGIAKAYSGWLGEGWEAIGSGGVIPSNAAFDVEAGKAAFIVFHHPRGIQLNNISCILSRQGGPASFHLLLTCSGQAKGLAFMSNFQDGKYFDLIFSLGADPASLELPRIPFEQCMNLNIQVGPNSAALSVDGGSQAETPLQIGPVTDAQLVIPAATMRQRIVVSRLHLSGL